MTMNSALGVVLLAVYLVAVLLVALRIPRNQLSEFELERRRKLGDPQAVFGAKRHAAYEGIVTLRWLLLLILGVCMLLLTLYLFHAAVTTLVVIIGLLLLGPLARLGMARRLSQRLYRKSELHCVQFAIKTNRLWHLLAPPHDGVAASSGALASREELLHLIDHNRGIISPDEITSLEHTLRFYEQTAEQVMTSSSSLVTVPASEVLGPLVIDDLHKSGHTLFPVVNDTEYVGLLDITNFTALRHHDSPVARDVMRADILRVGRDEPLDEVLKLLVAAKQACVFVTNDEGAIVGFIGLGDLIAALTGWKRR